MLTKFLKQSKLQGIVHLKDFEQVLKPTVSMPEYRFFINDPLREDARIAPDPMEFHHMIRVMRVKEGEQIEVINGQGILAYAIVETVEKKRAFLRIVKRTDSSPSPSLQIGIALLQGSRYETFFEKGTELGITSFLLFPGDRSKKKAISDSLQQRFMQIAISALKQSGNLYLPKLQIMPPLHQWKTFPNPTFFGDFSDETPIFEQLFFASQSSEQPAAPLFLVGPESGFSQREETLLRNKGALPVRLHTHILRSETAALMAASLMSHWQLIPRL